MNSRARNQIIARSNNNDAKELIQLLLYNDIHDQLSSVLTKNLIQCTLLFLWTNKVLDLKGVSNLYDLSFRQRLYTKPDENLYELCKNFFVNLNEQASQSKLNFLPFKKNKSHLTKLKNSNQIIIFSSDENGHANKISISEILAGFESYLSKINKGAWNDLNQVNFLIERIKDVVDNVIAKYVYKYGRCSGVHSNDFIHYIEAKMVVFMMNYITNYKIKLKLAESFSHNPNVLKQVNAMLYNSTIQHINKAKAYGERYYYNYPYSGSETHNKLESIYIDYANILYEQTFKNRKRLNINDLFLLLEFFRNTRLLYLTQNYDPANYKYRRSRKLSSYLDEILSYCIIAMLDNLVQEDYDGEFDFHSDNDIPFTNQSPYELFILLMDYFPAYKAVEKNLHRIAEIFNGFRANSWDNSIIIGMAKKINGTQDLEITIRIIKICALIFENYKGNIQDYELVKLQILLQNCVNSLKSDNDYSSSSQKPVLNWCNNLIAEIKSELARREYNTDASTSNNKTISSKKSNTDNMLLNQILENQKEIMHVQNQQQQSIDQIHLVQKQMQQQMQQMMLMMQQMMMANHSQQPNINSTQKNIMNSLNSKLPKPSVNINNQANIISTSASSSMKQSSNVMYVQKSLKNKKSINDNFSSDFQQDHDDNLINDSPQDKIVVMPK